MVCSGWPPSISRGAYQKLEASRLSSAVTTTTYTLLGKHYIQIQKQKQIQLQMLISRRNKIVFLERLQLCILRYIGVVVIITM